MIRPTLILRRPGIDLTRAQLTHISRAPISAELAAQQHANYRDALTPYVCEIVDLQALSGHPDCPFVEDMQIALPEAFILCRSGAVSRRGESASIAEILPTDRPQYKINAPATIDGGDVLRIGKTLYVGLSTRTNQAGIAQIAAAVRLHGYRVEAVAFSQALHLKTAVTLLAPDLLLINPNWVGHDCFANLHRIEVDPSEPFSANSLSIEGTVFMQEVHQKTSAKVRAEGFAVTLIDISEFAKAEAGLTCLSVVVPALQFSHISTS
jgi:dimethylargininase